MSTTHNPPVVSAVNLVTPVTPWKTRRNRKKSAKTTSQGTTSPIATGNESVQPTSTPKDGDEFATPLSPTPKKRNTSRGFFGTANEASQICAASERKLIVISRVHPATTPDSILDYIRERTDIEDVRCQMMLAKGRSISDVDYVSFKISATAEDYDQLMNPEVWPARVLVRDFVRTNRRRGRGATGFHKF
jgi:hypothetical protein